MKTRIIPESKKCRHCGCVRPSSDFDKAQKSADGLQCWCKSCKSEAVRIKYKKLADDKRKRIIEIHGPGDTKRCKSCEKLLPLCEYYKAPTGFRGVHSKCRLCVQAINAEKRTAETRRKRAEYTKKWRAENKEKRNQYEAKKQAADPSYKAFVSTRKRISGLIRSGAKVSKTRTLIGCSPDFLRAHLEAQFKPGMTWDNYGRNGWHIDHIYPCSAFDLTDPEEQKRCFHYSNLQPMWESDNCRKSNYIESNQPKPLALEYA